MPTVSQPPSQPKNNFFDDQKQDQGEKIVLPKRHNWIWVILILLIAGLAAAGYWYTQRGEKETPQPTATDFTSCKDAGGQILESFPEQCKLGSQTFTNPNQVAPKPEETVETPIVKLKTYTDATNKYSFSYSDKLAQTEADVNTPYTANPVPVTSQVFSHSIPVQHCNLKGDCVPTTTDFSLSATVVNSSVATISASPKMAGMTNVTFGKNTFKTLEQGVEGEGIVYYFISLPSGKTLMLSQKFINEEVLAGYKDAKDFIKKVDQDKMAAQILASLEFQK